MTETALAFDLGGTELRAALVDSEGQVLAFDSTPTRSQAGPQSIVQQMEDLAANVRSRVAGAAPLGIGIGAPGPLDPVAGIVIAPPTLAGWAEVPLAHMLQNRFNLPVRLENDANAAALGEWHFGAGRGADTLVFVTVSTGIGGGIIADGRVLHGRRGLAGEIGHMTITDHSERCFCGAIGCFEAVASGTALGRRGTAMTRAGDGSVLRALSGDGDVTGRHVVEAARGGDATALRLIAEEGRWLGIGFTNLLHLYSPDRIVMGGGISDGYDLLRGHIDNTIRERAMSAYRDIPVVQARLGRHAGLVGAASLVFFRPESVEEVPGNPRSGKAPR